MRVKQHHSKYYEVLDELINEQQSGAFIVVQFKLPPDITRAHLFAAIDRKFPGASQEARDQKKRTWNRLLDEPYTSNANCKFVNIINDALHTYLYEIADHIVKEALK